MAGVMKDNANMFLDKNKNNYFGKTPEDIKGIILLYLANAVTKIQSIEQIDELCSQNALYKYKLCDNIAFWKLIWTKNITDEFPNPKKLLKIIDNLKLDKSLSINQSVTISSMEKEIKNYIKSRDKKEYLSSLYVYSLELYTYADKDILGKLGFNKLLEKAKNNDDALDQFYDDVNSMFDENIIINNSYWDDIDFIYDNENIFKNISELVSQRSSKDFIYEYEPNQIYEEKIYIDILIKKGFDINQMFTVGFKELNLLGYSILRAYPMLFEYLLKIGANYKEVSPGLDAATFITSTKKYAISVQKLDFLSIITKMLDQYTQQ